MLKKTDRLEWTKNIEFIWRLVFQTTKSKWSRSIDFGNLPLIACLLLRWKISYTNQPNNTANRHRHNSWSEYVCFVVGRSGSTLLATYVIIISCITYLCCILTVSHTLSICRWMIVVGLFCFFFFDFPYDFIFVHMSVHSIASILSSDWRDVKNFLKFSLCTCLGIFWWFWIFWIVKPTSTFPFNHPIRPLGTLYSHVFFFDALCKQYASFCVCVCAPIHATKDEHKHT